MNINVYLEDSLGRDLSLRARQVGKTRNAIIREAIKDWVQSHRANQWPRSVINFSGIKEVVAFELHRTDLVLPKEDPLE